MPPSGESKGNWKLDTNELIDKLRKCTGPDRGLDGRIAMVLGFRKKVEKITDASGQEKNKTVWLVPVGEQTVKIPFYTSKLDDAYAFATTIAPGQPIAVVSMKGAGRAAVGDGGNFKAATPALALCIAALNTIKSD